VKRLILIFLLFFSAFSIQAQKSYWLSYDVYLGDTVNIVDKDSLRQGRWVFLGKDKKGKKYRYYKAKQLVEDGDFQNGRKTGNWKTYHSNGKLESELFYVNDVADGPAKFYNNDGKIIAEGTIKGHDFIGKYAIYDELGNKHVKDAARRNQYAYLNFKGKVDKFGKGLDKVKIVVERNDFELMEIENNADGSFELKLELNFDYILRFTKEGFSDYTLEIDANVFDIHDTSIYKLEKWKISMTDNLVNSISSDFMGLLLNKPAGKIYFSKKRKKFTSDGAYVNLFNKQVKGISESTKLLLAQTAEDNKKLEIENLRMEAEKKMAEINMLKQAQELKEAEIRKKETELLAQKLEREKKEKDLALAEQEKRIKDLKYEQQKAELEKKQLEAERNTKEFERLAILRKMQEYELKEKEKALTRSSADLALSKAEIEKNKKELDLAEREKHLKEEEIKQHMFYVYILVGGLLLMLGFAFFIYRSFQQKKKANAILEQQSREIKIQKFEIEEKSKLIEQKNIETEQSIQYARRIQHAILPPEEEINQYLKDYFILYRSKDIVSGDFYFFSDKRAEEGKVFIASVDCTGHGVPGAFMSMIGYEKLKDAVDITNEPGEILTELNKGVKSALRQSSDVNSTRDGMDLCLCALPANANGKSTTITYAGANRPLWLIRKDSNIVEEIKATKVAIGGLTSDDQKFDQHEITLDKGDTIYLFSDGYADQFGGPKKKKLMTGKFKEILISVQHLSLPEQKVYLDEFITEWMTGSEQVDDILVIGIKV
jgi:serine phosphatase RsbU (regulator of sigma subunit)